MSLNTFNLENRVREFQKINASSMFDDFIREMQTSEIHLNNYINSIKTSKTSQEKKRFSEKISAHILGNLSSPGYLTQEGLGEIILDLISKYEYIHGLKNTRSVELKDKVSGEKHKLSQITHPLMVSIIPLLINRVFPDFAINNEEFYSRNIIPCLYHDIPEDVEKKIKTNSREIIIQISDFSKRLFFSEKPKNQQDLEQNYIKNILSNVTHTSDKSYENYILNLFFEKHGFEYFWHPEEIFFGGLYIKIPDALHNGTNQGIVRKMTQLDDAYFGNLGLSNERRMKGNLKSFSLLNPTAEFFNIKNKEGEIDSSYSSLFSLFFMLHSVTYYNLNKLLEGTRDMYKEEKPILDILDQLNNAIAVYSETPSLMEITTNEHDIQYYLDNKIDKSIFDGSINAIAQRVERMGEPLYSNMTKIYHLTKLYVHTLALRSVLGNTFKNSKTGLKYIKGFANIPNELWER
jgi:hypothetical protein